MNYGMYLSASGVMTNLHRQDVIANNLANASTAGFKRELVGFQQRDPEAIEDMLDPRVSNDLLDKLGGGAFVKRSMVDFTEGAVVETENDLDFAIEGPGFFVVGVDDADGREFRLSRDGRMTIDQNGQLATTVGGHIVMGSGNRSIIVDPSLPVVIDGAGNILQNGNTVSQLRLVSVADDKSLIPLGEGLYDADNTQLRVGDPSVTQVNQGYIEQSNVETIDMMVQMIESTRSISYNTQLMKYHDMILDRAVNTLGGVS